MRQNIFIIWNRTRFSDRLADTFAPDNILVRDEQFHTIPENIAAGIVLLAEYRGETRRYTELYGLEVLTVLRARYRLRCPIVVCSFLPFSEISGKSRIFDFPQHHPFLPLPATAEQMTAAVSDAEFADEPRLNDIIVNYCDPGGRLIELLTHGRLFVAIREKKQPFTAKKSSREIIDENLLQLKHYLSCGMFDPRISQTGDLLIAELKKGIDSSFFDFTRITSLTETLLSLLRK